MKEKNLMRDMVKIIKEMEQIKKNKMKNIEDNKVIYYNDYNDYSLSCQ